MWLGFVIINRLSKLVIFNLCYNRFLNLNWKNFCVCCDTSNKTQRFNCAWMPLFMRENEDHPLNCSWDTLWHLQTQLRNGSRPTFTWPFSYISFSSFTFIAATYRIFLLFLPWFLCHFYLVVIEQQLWLDINIILESLFQISETVRGVLGQPPLGRHDAETC